MKKDIEFSLTVDEDSSDDEEEKPGKVDNDQPASAEIDIWKEFHEMSVTSSQGTLAYDTTIHQPDLLMESDTLNNTDHTCCHSRKDTMHQQTPTRKPLQNLATSSHETPVSLADPDDDYGHSIWNYTLSDDMVTIPELGTFKRKKHFNGLVTVQLIEKMLSQSIPPSFSQ